MSHRDNNQTPDESGEVTTGFRADLLGKLDNSAAAATAAEVREVERLPSGSAVLAVQRGPNAGSRFPLNQPLTSAGRNADSDIYLDGITVSRRHAEFRREIRRDSSAFSIVDVGSLNGTYVNRQPVELAALTNGDEI